ncbi:MAG TPA: hypothetical protein VGB57_01810 [Allosphingosinicella sp.]|jgi:hypothetical protein
MLAVLLFAAAQAPALEDRAQFEVFWRENARIAAAAAVSKEAAWILWEWTQAQFSLGFCSQFISADVAENMRHIPDPDGKLAGTKLGRWFLDQSRASFREGMAFRAEVRPTLRLCEKELRERGETLEALKSIELVRPGPEGSAEHRPK